MLTKTAETIVTRVHHTKTAGQRKQANFIVGHLLQNLAGRGMLRAPGASGMEQLALRSFMRPDRPMATVGGNLLYGAAKGAVPEVGILAEQFGEMGHRFAKFLKDHNMTMRDLSNRDIVAIRRVLNGDFEAATKMRSPRARMIAQGFIESVFPQTRPLFQQGSAQNKVLNAVRSMDTQQRANLVQTATQAGDQLGVRALAPGEGVFRDKADALAANARVGLKELGKVWKENRFTGNLSRVLNERATQYADPELARMFTGENYARRFDANPAQVAHALRRKKGLAQKLREADSNAAEESLTGWGFRAGAKNVADAASSALVGLVDPGTGWVNAAKRIADSKGLAKFVDHTLLGGSKYNPMGTVQKNMTDAFVNQGMTSAFLSGMRGARRHPMQVENAVAGLTAAAKEGKLGQRAWDYTVDTGTSQIMNPFTAAMNDLSNGVGYALNRAGVTEDKVFGALRRAQAQAKATAGNAAGSARAGVQEVERRAASALGTMDATTKQMSSATRGAADTAHAALNRAESVVSQPIGEGYARGIAKDLHRAVVDNGVNPFTGKADAAARSVGDVLGRAGVTEGTVYNAVRGAEGRVRSAAQDVIGRAHSAVQGAENAVWPTLQAMEGANKRLSSLAKNVGNRAHETIGRAEDIIARDVFGGKSWGWNMAQRISDAPGQALSYVKGVPSRLRAFADSLKNKAKGTLGATRAEGAVSAREAGNFPTRHSTYE